jgi:hypothetical protein
MILVAQPIPCFKAFGAKGDGVTDDTAAIQAAVAALSVRGGDLLIDAPGAPAATYLVTSPIVIPPGVSIRGNGPGASNLVAPPGYAEPILQFNNVWDWTWYHGPSLQGFAISGNSEMPVNGGATATGIQILNSSALNFRDVSIINCAIGVENKLTNAGQWCERVIFDRLTLKNNRTGVLLNNATGVPNTPSFSRHIYHNVFFNTLAGDAVFKLLGSPAVYSGEFNAHGNMGCGVPGSGGDCIFDLSDGSSLGPYCKIEVEAESGGPSIAFHGAPDTLASSLDAFGWAVIAAGGQSILRDGNWARFDLGSIPAGAYERWPGAPLRYAMTVTTTANPSDTFPTVSGFSLVQKPDGLWLPSPVNAAARAMAGSVYVQPGVASLVLVHPPVAGAQFAIFVN